MGGLLPGVDVESQRPKIPYYRGLLSHAHQHWNLQKMQKPRGFSFINEIEILRKQEKLHEYESLLKEVGLE